MTRSTLCIALLLALSAVVPAHGAALHDPFADPQWPSVALDGEPQWPNIKSDDLPDPRPNPRPSFLDPEAVASRIIGDHWGPAAAAIPEVETTGSTSRWSQWPAQKETSGFAFEVGARYWYSTGSMNFSFTNMIFPFGSPTSTLNWQELTGHSGEIFGRVDHKPSGFFVKGAVAAGIINRGKIDDLDFVIGQIEFSDTTSEVKDGAMVSAMIDIGWSYAPTTDIRIGFFVGYHYWREHATAFGVRCNPISPQVIGGCPAGSVPIGFDVPSLRYEPTWHAMRIGFEGKMTFAERWSVSGEIAVVPYASLTNKDFHLLRQDLSDLGPAPNIITKSNYAYGVETEVFINYALTPNIEIGGGFRYWGLVPYNGNVTFGPDFSQNFPLDTFGQQRYGMLLQVKGKF